MNERFKLLNWVSERALIGIKRLALGRTSLTNIKMKREKRREKEICPKDERLDTGCGSEDERKQTRSTQGAAQALKGQRGQGSGR